MTSPSLSHAARALFPQRSSFQHCANARFLVRRVSSTSSSSSSWRSVPVSDDASIVHRSTTPVKLCAGQVAVDAEGTWLTRAAETDGRAELNVAYLSRHAESLFLPMELTVAGAGADRAFHRSEGVPLGVFLASWPSPPGPSSSSPSSSPDSDAAAGPSVYIAQSPLSLLPPDLAAAFPTPEALRSRRRGSSGTSALETDVDTDADANVDFNVDVYASSLWLGRPPTATPLHRDPNPNLFVQVAGRKVVRLLEPGVGGEVLRRVREQIDTDADTDTTDPRRRRHHHHHHRGERIRGEEMMAGPERERLEAAVWGGSDPDADGDGARTGRDGHAQAQARAPYSSSGAAVRGWQAVLDRGEALYIPLGWWHAVRSVDTAASSSSSSSSSVNLSVNWWFRSRPASDTATLPRRR